MKIRVIEFRTLEVLLETEFHSGSVLPRIGETIINTAEDGTQRSSKVRNVVWVLPKNTVELVVSSK